MGLFFLAAQEGFIMGKKLISLLFKQNVKKKEQVLLDKERFVSNDEMNDIHVLIQMAALC